MRPPTAGSHYGHGSAQWYRDRLEEVATENDGLRVELDAYKERDAGRCAQRRDLLDRWELGERVVFALREENHA